MKMFQIGLICSHGSSLSYFLFSLFLYKSILFVCLLDCLHQSPYALYVLKFFLSWVEGKGLFYKNSVIFEFSIFIRCSKNLFSWRFLQLQVIKSVFKHNKIIFAKKIQVWKLTVGIDTHLKTIKNSSIVYFYKFWYLMILCNSFTFVNDL